MRTQKKKKKKKGNEGQSTSSSRNSSDGKSYLLPETLEENVTSILNEQRDLQKVINLLQVIKQRGFLFSLSLFFLLKYPTLPFR